MPEPCGGNGPRRAPRHRVIWGVMVLLILCAVVLHRDAGLEADLERVLAFCVPFVR